MKVAPLLSIVIIGRNEGDRLERCIRSVQAIHTPPPGLDVLYVDSDSIDGSLERAKTLGVRVLTVHPERPTAALGRNAGWRALTTPFILFLDGDTILHPDFINHALPHFADPKIAAVWGHLRELAPEASVYQRVLNLDWVYRFGFTEFCGGNALMRREALEKVNGYNEALIAGEEPEMCQRMRAFGYSILHIDQPMVLHDLGITRWSQYWRRTTRTGHAFAEVSTLLRDTATPLWRYDALRNLVHASILVTVFGLGAGASLIAGTFWPFLASLGFLSALVVRTVWKARWKSKQWFSLLLYGLHSQFQHIPTAIGQLSYYYNRWRGRRRHLIEYK